MATSTAVAAPATAQRWAFTLKPASNPNSTIIGSAATSVESHQCPNGSYTCVQVTTHPPGNKNQKLCNAELLQRRGEHKTGHFGARPSLTFGCWDTSSRPQCQALTLGINSWRFARTFAQTRESLVPSPGEANFRRSSASDPMYTRRARDDTSNW